MGAGVSCVILMEHQGTNLILHVHPLSPIDIYIICTFSPCKFYIHSNSTEQNIALISK